MNVGSCAARLLIALTLLSLAGCETRSISNSGYPAPYAGNMLYSGELNEFDLLGMGRNQPITDADIQQALAVKAPFRVKQRSSVMLIQSGAMFPDEPMMTSMAHHYIVGAFSGIPERDAVAAGSPNPPAPYSMALRLVAARGGYETIMVYWGILETARARKAEMIVMASHGRKGLSAMLIGSETQKVVNHSHIPVVIYR